MGGAKNSLAIFLTLFLLHSATETRPLISSTSRGHLLKEIDGFFGAVNSSGPSSPGGGHRPQKPRPLGETKYSGPSPGAGHEFGPVVQEISSPVVTVWSVVRCFVTVWSVGTLCEVSFISSLPAARNLKILEEERHVISFSIVGGDHRRIRERRLSVDATPRSSVALPHVRGMHRDVKPDNLLFDRRNNLKVADFRSAVWLPEGRCVGGVVGTSYYVVPEVLMGREYNEKVDVWSAGVILYIMLAMVPPFYGEFAVEIFETVLRGNLRFPTRIFRTVSPVAKDLLRKAGPEIWIWG
ncbi:hypothetical protein FH972_004580 [Carpinus fangiana]|uniref:Protein kinase domain-containing protein n=1 Tax=Carpinus fangiana TaxID=176857 RepID=A0A5N6QLJ9_9ROSI|nr:hypothetical protein FH972_004580 [Carpinus fangiana]